MPAWNVEDERAFMKAGRRGEDSRYMTSTALLNNL